MTRVPASVDEFDWARLVERLCYLFPPVIGVGAVGALRAADPAVPALQRGLVLVGSVGYAALTLGIAVAVFFDARRIRRRSKAGGDWRPNPWLNAAAAAAWAPAAGVLYLTRRHRRFGTPPGRSGWWLVVALSLATTVGGALAGLAGVALAVPGLLTAGVGLAGAVAFGAFPVAIHRDAAYVCTRGESWRPNPGVYLGLAFVSLAVPPLQPVVAGYYLYRRRTAVGTP